MQNRSFEDVNKEMMFLKTSCDFLIFCMIHLSSLKLNLDLLLENDILIQGAALLKATLHEETSF